MILCLVTDRRRLGQALGAPSEAWVDLLKEQVAAAAVAGVDLVQVREPDLDARALVDLVRSLVGLTAGTNAQVLVNDRVDVALAAGASGVHLKERGFRPQDVRAFVPAGFVIGCSVHSPAAAAARHVADYLVAGTVQPTASKPGATHLDHRGLRAIVEAAAGKPVLGIGGLNAGSMATLAGSGVAGAAVVGALIPDRAERDFKFVQKRVTDLRFALESVSSGT